MKPEIPAQKHALRYLKNFFAHHPKQKVTLGGHSKGGNLAIYAASQIEQSFLQDQITAVYTFWCAWSPYRYFIPNWGLSKDNG